MTYHSFRYYNKIELKQSLPCVKGGGFWVAKDGGIVIEYKHNKSLVGIGRIFRKNMTPEERHLWYDFFEDISHKI